jgi:Fungal specific transcription factor domain
MLQRNQILANVKEREKSIKRLYPPRRKRTFPFGDAFGGINFSESSRLSDLPPRSMVETLVEHYLITFDRLFPLFHGPTLQAEITKFYANPDSVSNSWLAQLYMILALTCYASPSCSFDNYSGGHIGLSDRLMNGAEATFTQTAFLLRPDHGSFTTIRVLCLIAIAKHMDIVTRHDSDSCWQYMGLVVRSAMSLWLHRNPDIFTTMPRLEAQMRKRIWATVQLLDLVSSIDSGMQIQCRPEDFDTSAPSDADADASAGFERGPETFYQGLLIDALPALSRTINKMNGPFPDMEYSEVIKLDTTLRDILHAVEDSQFLNTANPKDAEWIHLQQTTLSNLIRRVLLAVHQPWAKEASESPHYQTSHWTVLQCALAILRHHHFLCDDPRLEWASELVLEDFKLAFIHVCLGLRRKHFSDKLEPGQSKSAKELAWEALRFSFENIKNNFHRSSDQFKAFMGTTNMIAVLEAMDTDTPAIEACQKATAQAFDIAEERLRSRSSAAPSENTAESSMDWSSSASATGSNGYGRSPLIYSGIIDPQLGGAEDPFGEFGSVSEFLESSMGIDDNVSQPGFDEFLERMFLKQP